MQAQAIRGFLHRPRLANAAIFTSTFRPFSRPISQSTSSSSSALSSNSSFSFDTSGNSFIDSGNTLIETITREPTFFEPISSTLLSIPPSFALSYAVGIPLLTLLIRTTTTLPLTLWQRSRTRKFEDVVMPLIQRAQVISEIEVRAECRKANKTYEEYQAIHKIRAKDDAAKISKKHNVHPMLTLILPPLLHLPIFVCATLTIRDACQRSLDALILLPNSVDSSSIALTSTTSTSSNFYTDEALSHLHNLATTPLLWCESMVLPDPTMAFPLAVGLVLLANVEASAKNRTAIAKAHALITASKQAEDPANIIKRVESKRGKDLTSQDRAILRRKREIESNVIRMGGKVANSSVAKEEPKAAIELQIKPETRFSRNFTTVLRIVSVCFIPFAAFSPSAVCAYWLTSNLFTLVQNTIFAALDKKRADGKLRIRSL